MVEKDLDKLLEATFIKHVETTKWVSFMVLVLKEKWQAKGICKL